MAMKLSGRNLMVSGTSSVLLPNSQICQQGSVMGPVWGGFTSVSSYMETAIINGAISMLHNLVLLANHCLPLVMVSNPSGMRRSGVVLCSVDGIRHSGRHGEAALLPVGVTHPLAVSVAIMGMLDRRCGHEAEWQESSGQWHSVGPSAKYPDLSTRKCYGPGGGWLYQRIIFRICNYYSLYG